MLLSLTGMRAPAFVATAVLATLVALAPPATAQDRQRRTPRGEGGGGGSTSQSGRSDGQRTAAPREGGRVQQAPREGGRTAQRDNGRREVTPPTEQREVAPPPPQAQPRRQPLASASSERRADGRPDGRYDANGRYAVPRTGPTPYYRDGDHRVYVKPGQNYYVYRYPAYRYGYPARYYGYPYPYYGYSYYDPYYTGAFYWSNHAWQSGAYYNGGNAASDLGKLRLDMQPREAEVYIDGYYAGVVDDFDGRLQGLRLETGNYRVQVTLPGFAPLDFDVHVQPGRTTTYRGELVPQQ